MPGRLPKGLLGPPPLIKLAAKLHLLALVLALVLALALALALGLAHVHINPVKFKPRPNQAFLLSRDVLLVHSPDWAPML